MIKYRIFKIALIIIIFFSLACQKTQTVSELVFQRNLLSGIGTYQNTQRIWKIDSLFVNDTIQNLTPFQKLYTKTFTYDGYFNDFDGVTGKWKINELNTLNEYLYDTTGRYIYDSLKYQINEINSLKFTCTLISTKKIKYKYVISK